MAPVYIAGVSSSRVRKCLQIRLMNSAFQAEKPDISMVSKLNPDQLNNSGQMRSKTYCCRSMRTLTPLLAAKIIAAVDADLVRRRKPQDAEEERHVAPLVETPSRARRDRKAS
jgi:hypothetical protein